MTNALDNLLAEAVAAFDAACEECPRACDSDNICARDGRVMAYVTVRPSVSDDAFREAMEGAGFTHVVTEVVNYYGVFMGTGMTFEWRGGAQ